MKSLKSFLLTMFSRSVAATVSVLEVCDGDILHMKVSDGIDHKRAHEVIDGVLRRAKINNVKIVVSDSKTEFTVLPGGSDLVGRIEALEAIAKRQGVQHGTRGGNPGGAGGDPGSGD